MVVGRNATWLLQYVALPTLAMSATNDSSPIVRLNRAIAIAELDGPDVALAELDRVDEALRRYHAYHAARADLLRRIGIGQIVFRVVEVRGADHAAAAGNQLRLFEHVPKLPVEVITRHVQQDLGRAVAFPALRNRNFRFILVTSQRRLVIACYLSSSTNENRSSPG